MGHIDINVSLVPNVPLQYKGLRCFKTLFLIGALVLWGGSFSFSHFCNAQDDDEDALLGLYGDKEMISIATGKKQPIAKAPAVATVVTAQDIRDIGALDIDEVLETVPGLHVNRDFTGYSPLYIFRGISAAFNPQVLMLINSIPITNLSQGDRNRIWGGMPVNAISRIEIIRGPGSAVYGADAFAGVINIITKTADEIDGTEVGARAGTFDTRDAWLLHGGIWGGFELAFALEYHRTDGQDSEITADAQSGLDAIPLLGTNASHAPDQVNLERNNLDLRMDVARGKWRLRAGLQRRRDWGNGVGIAGALDPTSRYASDRWNVDIGYHEPELENWDIQAQISYLDTTQEAQDPLMILPAGTNPGLGVFSEGMIGSPEAFERHNRIDLSASYSGFHRHQLRTGLGYYYGDLYKIQESKNFSIDPATGLPVPLGNTIDVSDTPAVFLREDDRKNFYGFIQDIWKFSEGWELTLGIRHDEYSDFGSTTNPRIALVWSTTVNLSTKLLYGQAFRSPSFVQTKAINNPSVLGNEDLDPETLKSYEMAFDYRPTDQVRIGLNLFRYYWDDIIEFVPDPGLSTSTAQNSGEQSGQGWELEASWNATPQLRLNGNFSFQRAWDEDTEIFASHSPQQQFYIAVNWDPTENWHLNTELNWVMNRKRAPQDPRPEIEDYRLTNITLKHQNRAHDWSFTLSVKNVFNSDAREPSPWSDPVAAIPNDLPLHRRSYYGEVQYKF